MRINVSVPGLLVSSGSEPHMSVPRLLVSGVEPTVDEHMCRVRHGLVDESMSCSRIFVFKMGFVVFLSIRLLLVAAPNMLIP